MKAKDWVSKFAAVADYTEVLREYGEETAKLVLARTKTSTPSSKFSAAEGAVREQQTKFRAIAQKVTGLDDTTFENMLNTALPDYQMWRETSQKRTQGVVDDVTEYGNQRGRLLVRK